MVHYSFCNRQWWSKAIKGKAIIVWWAHQGPTMSLRTKYNKKGAVLKTFVWLTLNNQKPLFEKCTCMIGCTKANAVIIIFKTLKLHFYIEDGILLQETYGQDLDRLIPFTMVCYASKSISLLASMEVVHEKHISPVAEPGGAGGAPRPLAPVPKNTAPLVSFLFWKCFWQSTIVSSFVYI